MSSDEEEIENPEFDNQDSNSSNPTQRQFCQLEIDKLLQDIETFHSELLHLQEIRNKNFNKSWADLADEDDENPAIKKNYSLLSIPTLTNKIQKLERRLKCLRT